MKPRNSHHDRRPPDSRTAGSTQAMRDSGAATALAGGSNEELAARNIRASFEAFEDDEEDGEPDDDGIDDDEEEPDDDD